MTSSLVGSEMCIRDRVKEDKFRVSNKDQLNYHLTVWTRELCRRQSLRPVSYTHLTLPTICSV
eukprot:6682629-Prorocentrum_lima.AAC.1